MKVVQQMLGHSGAAMTMDVYGHLFSDRLDEVADALDHARTEAAKAPRATKEPAVAVANTPNGVANLVPNAEVMDLTAYKAKGKTAGQRRNSQGCPR